MINLYEIKIYFYMSLNNLDNLIKEVIDCHYKHYINNKCSLIDTNIAPNSNTIYHLYNDGEITSQKGSYVYKQRSEFMIKPPLYNLKNINIDFPLKYNNKNNISYAILTRVECEYFYDKLKGLFEL